MHKIRMSMLVAFEFPDRETDAAFGKRTLTVRLGAWRAAWLHHGLLILAFGLFAAFLFSGSLSRGIYLVFLALPLAAWQAVRLLWQLRKRNWPDGLLFLVYLSLYSVMRFSLAFTSSYQIIAFGLTQSQIIALVVLLMALPILVRMQLRRHKLTV